jgi:hypothetical protein
VLISSWPSLLGRIWNYPIPNHLITNFEPLIKVSVSQAPHTLFKSIYMKSLKLITLASFILIAIASNAQTQAFSLSVGAGFSNFSANNNSKSSTGLGADLTVRTDFSETVQGFAQTGYNAFLSNGYNVAFIPMLVGVNLKLSGFTPGFGFGYGSSTAGGSSVGGFTYSPQIGYNFDKYELVAHYTSTNLNTGTANNWSIAGIKLLYKLK